MAAPLGLGLCAVCGGRSKSKDIFGHGWCELHEYRIAIADYGKRTNYRAVSVPPGAIGEGYELWKMTVGYGREAFLQTVYEAIKPVMATVTPDIETIERKGA